MNSERDRLRRIERVQRELRAEMNGANANRAENKVDPQSIDAAHEELAERKDRIAAMDQLVREIVQLEARIEQASELGKQTEEPKRIAQ